MAETPKAKIELCGADPALPFYITADLYQDGSVDIANEGKDPLSLDDALEEAKTLVEDHGGEMYVIECRAIRKIVRQKVKVMSLKTKPTRPAQ